MDQSLQYSGRVFERLVDECRPRWHCLRTRPGQGLGLARALAEDGLRVFAPVERTTTRHGHAWMDVDLPVFPELVFVFTTGSFAAAIAADRRVRDLVPLHDPVAASVKDMTVSRVRELLGISDSRVPEPDGPASRHDMPSSGSWADL